ncbi:hypothetical protein CR513_05332, partial [Mucuna pruriens]
MSSSPLQKQTNKIATKSIKKPHRYHALNIANDGRHLLPKVGESVLHLYTSIKSGTIGFESLEGFDKIKVYRSALRDHRAYIESHFHANALNMEKRLFAFLIAWGLAPRGANMLSCLDHSEGYSFGLLLFSICCFGILDYDYFKEYVKNEVKFTLRNSNKIIETPLHKMGLMDIQGHWMFKHD